MEFRLFDGIDIPIDDDSVDGTICIDTAHWQTHNDNTNEEITLVEDPMLQGILRITKEGGLIHIHSQKYEVAGTERRAQGHLRIIAESSGIELESLGKTFEDNTCPCGYPVGYKIPQAELFLVKRKPK